MSNIIVNVVGGGVFSTVFQCLIEPLAANGTQFDNIYIKGGDLLFGTKTEFFEKVSNGYSDNGMMGCAIESYTKQLLKGIENPSTHLFDTVFDQSIDASYTEISETIPIGKHTIGNIKDEPLYEKYREVARKIKIHPNILQYVNNFCLSKNIQNTLGVHIRLTSWTSSHFRDNHNYTLVSSDTYIKEIERLLHLNHYDNIFVASDNDESIELLKLEFGDMVINTDFTRHKTQFTTKEDDLIEFKNYYQEFWWEEAFKDCLILGRCKDFLGRESNLGLASACFSPNGYNNIYNVFNWSSI